MNFADKVKLKDSALHFTPGVLNSLTGLEAVGPRREFNVASRPDGADLEVGRSNSALTETVNIIGVV